MQPVQRTGGYDQQRNERVLRKTVSDAEMVEAITVIEKKQQASLRKLAVVVCGRMYF